MGKFRRKDGVQPPLSAQIFSAFVFAAALALAFAANSPGEDNDRLEGADPNLANNGQPARGFPQVHPRWKRDLTGDILDVATKYEIGGSYLAKFKKLVDGTPPTVKHAFLEGDFSNVTENDIRGMNVSVLEYVPPNIIEKMSSANPSLLMPIIEKFLDFNRPNALGRLMSVAADKLDAETLIGKVKEHGGVTDDKNEAASVLLYGALNKIGEKNGISYNNVRTLLNDNLLQLVPEEQLMKVTDPQAAKLLLSRVYAQATGSEHDDVDDKALIYQLANAAYGKASTWSSNTLTEMTSKILSQMPASALRDLSPDVVAQSIGTLRNTKFESPLQMKSITDKYLEKAGIQADEDEESEDENVQNLDGVVSTLGKLAAFVNPSLAHEKSSVLGSIIRACDQLNLPAPILAIKNFIKAKTGDRKLDQLSTEDIKGMGIEALKNGPPELMNLALQKGALETSDLNNLVNTRPDSGGLFSSFLQGIISQVASYAVKAFSSGGKIDFSALPGAFMGAVGIKGVNNMSNRDMEDAIIQLKNNPDSLDDAQKAALLKKLRDEGMDNVDLPPELRALLPRKSMGDLPPKILDGLPSDSELRLAHGSRKGKITAADLEKDKNLVGTLTPTQVKEMDLADIPAVLAAVRESKDGPQPQTLKVLADRFKEYIRQKSEDYDSDDKKLLKHITAAEVTKLPATVLAYFIDPKQTKKLPNDVRKEILIAMGELSTKDHANIPRKTREQIILQGLAALDAQLDAKKSLGAPELAAIGGGVVDLPPERIQKLTPVAFEQALGIIQGTADDDDDGLKQRACLNPEQKKAWRDKLIENFGQLENWDAATTTSLCCSLGLLDVEELHLLDKSALATCRCPSDEEPPSHLAELKKALNVNCKKEANGLDLQEHKRQLERAKTEVDLDDLESQIISGRRRRRETDDSKEYQVLVTCYKVRIIGSAAPLDKESVESIPDGDVHNCIYELGKDPVGPEIARVLWEKLIRNRGGIGSLTSTDYRYAGHILSGIRLEEVSQLDFSDPDIVAAFGRTPELSKTILEKMAMHLEEKSGKGPQDFGTTDLAAAKNILCGFSPDKLRQINSEAFRDALPVLKTINGSSCELTRLQALAKIAVREDVLGEPKMWTAADVRGVGVLINGLDEVTVIPPEALLGITPTVAETLPESVLSNLSPQQLEHIPRFSVQALSEEQMSYLSADAQNALDVRGPETDSKTVTIQTSLTTCATLVIAAIFAQRIL